MIEVILDTAAAGILENVAAVTQSTGAVQTVQLRDGNRVRNVPAVPSLSDASSQESGYTAVLPSDGQAAVAFWQVLTIAPDEKRGPVTKHTAPMKARCRLVVWANKRRLSPPDVNAVLARCIAQVVSADLNTEYLQGATANLFVVERRDRAVFSEYGFDETETQYLAEPYDFASALFDVQYTVMFTCMPEVAAVEPSC